MSEHIRLTLLLKPAEYAEAKRRAGLIPLSTWFRNIALGDGTNSGLLRGSGIRVGGGGADAEERSEAGHQAAEASGGRHRGGKGPRDSAKAGGGMQGAKGSAAMPGSDSAGGSGESGAGEASQDTCSHGASYNRCKVWGCYFYEVVNGRGPRLK